MLIALDVLAVTVSSEDTRRGAPGINTLPETI